MKRLIPAIVAVSAVVAASAAAGVTLVVRPPDARAAGAARPVRSWGTAIEVPGLAALNKGGSAKVTSVSCATTGNCAAGGDYTDRRGHLQGFVAAERHGRWGTAIEVPGLGFLNAGGFAEVESVSCASAGNCTAGGANTDRRGHLQGFVAAERHGRWGTAIEVPGLAALNKGGSAGVTSVSCGSAGNCAAGGGYFDRRDNGQGFVAAERHGRWGTAIEVPGLGALNTGDAAVLSVSCGSAGNCAAGGGYFDRRDNGQGFVVAERHGRWGTAIEVPGLGALNKQDAEVTSVSCASAGNCAAGGEYTAHFGWQGFVAVERHGRWGTAIEVPGLAALNQGNFAELNSLSCASAGNCAAGGGYLDRRSHLQGFVAAERHGRWGTATEVPGLGALSKGAAAVDSLSCGSAGNCAAGGHYIVAPGHPQGFADVERHGRWGTAIEVPGLVALNKRRNAQITSVSCAPAGTCAAGGSYTDASGHSQGFVVSQTRQDERRSPSS